MTDLLKLAERVEAATGPDRKLDAEIAAACEWVDVRNEGYGSWRGVRPSSGKREHVCRFTASLDAAMTLVPEGCHFEVHSTLLGRPDDKPLAGVWWKPEGAALKSSKARATGRAATPALALCAAAFRARAGETE